MINVLIGAGLAMFNACLTQKFLTKIAVSALEALVKNTKNTLDDVAVNAAKVELKKAGLL